MELGMYSVELKRDSIEELFAAVRGYGFTAMQFDYLSVCDEEMPAHIDSALTARIRAAAQANGVKIVSVNGTFNMIHPDPAVRADGLARFEELAKHMKELDCNFVTMCTGSRSTESMWRFHPDSLSGDAWQDLLEKSREAAEENKAAVRAYEALLTMHIPSLRWIYEYVLDVEFFRDCNRIAKSKLYHHSEHLHKAAEILGNIIEDLEYDSQARYGEAPKLELDYTRAFCEGRNREVYSIIDTEVEELIKRGRTA